MKKNLANIITSSRIVCALWLFFFGEISGLFMAVYGYCGFSDLIDGPIARKLDTKSLLGAKLDTTGDVLTYLALLKVLILQSLIPIWVIIWIAVNCVGFIVGAYISKVRHGKFYFVHSLFGKIMGAAIFIIPFAVNLITASVYLGIVCTVISIAAIESIVIQAKSKEIITDTTSLKLNK